MTEAPDTTADTSEPLAYSFSWTPALYGELVGRRPPAGLGLTGSRRFMLLAVAGAVGLIALVALIPAPLGIYPLESTLVALWGAAGGLLSVLVIVLPHMQRARIAADLATRIRQGEMHVRLSADGVETESELARGFTRWPGVALVSETPRAVLLWIGAAYALPVPDAALPEGVTRSDVLARIARWREAA